MGVTEGCSPVCSVNVIEAFSLYLCFWVAGIQAIVATAGAGPLPNFVLWTKGCSYVYSSVIKCCGWR